MLHIYCLNTYFDTALLYGAWLPSLTAVSTMHRYQKDMGDWGTGITFTLPTGAALEAAKAGQNASSDPSSFASVKSVSCTDVCES